MNSDAEVFRQDRIISKPVLAMRLSGASSNVSHYSGGNVIYGVSPQDPQGGIVQSLDGTCFGIDQRDCGTPDDQWSDDQRPGVRKRCLVQDRKEQQIQHDVLFSSASRMYPAVEASGLIIPWRIVLTIIGQVIRIGNRSCDGSSSHV
ncbi:hypothetical protein STEG23_008516 [Scotinomys teguina]